MKLFLAGGVSANLKPLWSKIINMQIFLAGTYSRSWVFDTLIRGGGICRYF